MLMLEENTGEIYCRNTKVITVYLETEVFIFHAVIWCGSKIVVYVIQYLPYGIPQDIKIKSAGSLWGINLIWATFHLSMLSSLLYHCLSETTSFYTFFSQIYLDMKYKVKNGLIFFPRGPMMFCSVSTPLAGTAGETESEQCPSKKMSHLSLFSTKENTNPFC